MGTGEFNAGGNPAMDWHPIQGGVEIFLVASCHRNGISFGLMGHLARMQTLPSYLVSCVETACACVYLRYADLSLQDADSTQIDFQKLNPRNFI